jgi:hypothetical protein
MTASIKDLYDFIDTALRNRKYPPNTAQGYKAALRVFDAELNAEEKASVEKTLSNIDQISNLIFSKNKISAGSLATYKSRLIKVVNDYEKYGTDATKMANWNPKVIAPRVKRTAAQELTASIGQGTPASCKHAQNRVGTSS